MFESQGNVNASECRARCVASEANTVEDAHYFAATAPLEAKRLRLSQFAALRTLDGHPSNISLLARETRTLTASPTDTIADDIPRNWDSPMARLLLSSGVACCAEGAGSTWEAAYVDASCSMGFQRGRSPPCVLWHPELQIRDAVHGGDFQAPGTNPFLNVRDAALHTALDVKLRGRLGGGH